MVFSPKDRWGKISETLIRKVNLIGESPPFLEALEQSISIAPLDIIVLLLGETGTGKEQFARAIHQLSHRASGAFVPADCAALPETLFAHELFGHERGAFTDAREAKKGLITMASGGTLFLDEIESLSLGAQGALLRLLENKTWRPLGSPNFQPLNCRIIAASNQDLLQLAQDKTFRIDLYYRLSVSVVTLPPLRERRKDIDLLVRHFLHLYGRAYHREGLTVSQEALNALITYNYPGNIRELQNILQQAIIRAAGSCISSQDLPVPTPSTQISPQSWTEARRQAISSWEKAFLSHLLSSSTGNVSSVASQLHLSRQVLYRLLKRHQLFPLHRTGAHTAP